MMICNRYGMPLEYFNPLPFVYQWIADGKTRHSLLSEAKQAAPKPAVTEWSLKPAGRLIFKMLKRNAKTLTGLQQLTVDSKN